MYFTLHLCMSCSEVCPTVLFKLQSHILSMLKNSSKNFVAFILLLPIFHLYTKPIEFREIG